MYGLPWRLRARGALAVLLGWLMLSALLSACAPPSGDLAVTVTTPDGADVKPGDAPSFTVSVTNNGTTAATGVSVRVDLPPEFLYKSTVSIGGDGEVRTQPVDAGTNSPTPVWGLWSLAAPVVNADGTRRRSHVDVTYVVEAQGQPGDYSMVPRASSDGSEGLISGAALRIHLNPSSKLSMTLLPIQTTTTPGSTVDYRLIITNDGSGVASNLGVLLTLPPAFQFQSTQRVRGNAARGTPADPVRGAVVPFYGGFTLPGRSASGPGILSIEFRTRCVPAATGGTFGTTVQVTDSAGSTQTITDAARVTVLAPAAPTVPSPPLSVPSTARPLSLRKR